MQIFGDRGGFGEKIHLKEKLNFNQISMFIYSKAPARCKELLLFGIILSDMTNRRHNQQWRIPAG